jgi:oxaloacetate decarboxylase alpha subunit
MAMGTSHSPTETMVEILAGTEYDTGLDLKSLVEVSAYFREVRKKYKAFESSFVGADPRILVAQVPGGMLSNLESQLKEQNALDKLDAVLEEISIVQKDFGYPPLVTPTSQITGTQAVLNVLFGRYVQLSNESKNLLAGNYGKTPAKPNADLVARALKELNLKEAVTCRPADLIPNEFHKLEEELRQKMGVATVTREDVLTYAMFPQVALGFFKTRANGPVTIEAPKAEVAKAADKEHKHFLVMVDGVEHQVTRLPDADGHLHLHVNGTPFKVSVAKVQSAAAAATPPATPNATAAKVLAPMPGKILSLSVPEGARVEKDQPICTMEALKMEMAIKTPQSGTVRFVAKEGSTVKAGDVLAEIV